MAKKKTPPVRPSAITQLQRRVATLEDDFREMRHGMSKLSEELGELRATVRHVDERTMRGEKLMLEMQVEQRRMARSVERIVDALHIPAELSKQGA
jgi:septal ring factor EnvC (AmiA/AmiB activator)